MTTGASFYRVSDRGHGIAVHTAPERTSRRRGAEPDEMPVVVVRAAPAAAVAIALRVAGGDASRLVFNGDGSVTVANKSRSAR